MLIYNTATSTLNGLSGEGFYVWQGGATGAWQRLSTAEAGAFNLIDIDGDTQVQVEESPDDDTIRLDAAGVEIATFTSTDTTIANDLTVQGSSSLATTTLGAVLQDYEGDAGTAGQVLSSTGTSTNWISVSVVESPISNDISQLADGGGLALDGARGVFVQGDYAYVAASVRTHFR